MYTWLIHWTNWAFIISFLVGMGLATLTVLGFSKDGDHDFDVSKPEADTYMNTLSALGMGKIPVSVLLEVLFVGFGLIGLVLSALMHDLFGSWGLYLFPFTLVVAAAGSAVTTRLTADLVNHFAPAGGTTSRRMGEFAGSTGRSVTQITHTIGQIRVEVEGRFTADALLNACVDPEFEGVIPRDTDVYVVSYDPTRCLYRVRPLDTTRLLT